MRTDAFGSGTAPAPKTADTKLPSASPIAKAAAEKPTPAPKAAAPTPAPEPAPQAPVTQGIGGTDGATPSPPAPAAPAAPAPAPLPAKAEDDKTPHMPPVGTVTAGNPTGDPNLNNDGTPKTAGNTAATSDGAPRPNDTRRDDLLARVKNLGQAEGAGENSRPELALAIVAAVRDGVISAKKSSTDLSDMWDAFLESRAATAATPRYAGAAEKKRTKSNEVQLSKLRQFAKVGDPDNKYDGVKVMAKARDIIKTFNVKEVKGIKISVFDMMLNVARAQLDHAKKNDGKALAADEIRKALVPPQPEPEDITAADNELIVLRRVEKQLLTLLDGSDDYGPRENDLIRNFVTKGLRMRIVAVEKETGKAPKDEAPPVSPPASQTNASKAPAA